MQSYHYFVPPKSVQLLQCWIDDLNVKVVISSPRKTKLGDFKVKNQKMVISVNNNLNPYSFLITFTHELAHAFVFRKHKNKVSPHALSWKLTFKSMLLNFLSPEFFPDDVLKVLSKHIINPKASTFSDLELVKVLRKYDNKTSLTISDIVEGGEFSLTNGKTFIKGKQLRKRFRCVEQQTNKVYLFHPFAEVIAVQ